MNTRAVTEKQSRDVAEAARQQEWEAPSFAKELFLGRFQWELIHPHPRPSAEAKAKGEVFLARLESFLRSEVDPEVIERDAKIPDSVVKGLCDLGALGMKIDEQYGGLGLTNLYYNKALALAGTCHSAISTLLSAHQSIGVPQPLKLFGTPEQKRKYLPRVARDQISAFLLTEPDVGSDPARMQCNAVPTEDGSAYIINGNKLWTTNGVVADLLVVMAVVPRSEGHRGGITAFIVDAHSPGVKVTHRNQFMGLRGIENGVTQFENVRVPVEDVVGGEGRGLKVALQTLNTGRLSLPGVCVASSKLALKIVREWANERVQWGMPIGKHEAVAEKIAFIAGLSFAQEAVLELSSLLADAESHDIRIEAALAKLYCSEMAWQVMDETVQIRGGRGYETASSLKARGEKPVPVEQMLRDLRICRIFEGSTEIMKLLIAREAVDQHLAVAGAIIDPNADASTKAKTLAKAGAFYGKWLPRLAVGPGHSPRSYSEFGTLATHLRFVERASRKLARSTFYAMSRWRGKLERKQGFLGRIVDIGAELYAMSASCARAQMLAEDRDVDAVTAFELADLFCTGARRRVDRLFDELWNNDDAENYAAAQAVLSGRYTWAEVGVIDPSEQFGMFGSEIEGLPESVASGPSR